MSERPIRAAVAGAAGRMGRALVAACAADDGFELASAFERADSGLTGTDAGEVAGLGAIGVPIAAGAALDGVEVLIDFTLPEASAAHAAACAERGVAMVIGTTGFATDQRAAVDAAARVVPVVLAPNMSVGVNVCLDLVATAARVLGEDFDVEVIEAHHRHKVDAPSGTALALGESVAKASGRDLGTSAVFAREGRTGPRPEGAIGFATVRAGEIVGEHTVMFVGPGERIEITHRAASRENFARGALRAAGWLRGREPGLYTMADVLGLA